MNQRILVIDDNPAIHNDIRKILCRSIETDPSMDTAEAILFGEESAPDVGGGFEIESAFQGQDGLEMVRRALAEGDPYPLAFVDIRMPPGWDGVETITRIWEICPDIQIVICTAYSDYSWQEISRRLPKSDGLLILKKPFDNIEVLQMAHALTKKWSLAQEAKSRLADLDQIVNQRTQELQFANQRLTQEITERSEAEKQLRLSEERFAKAFKSSPVPMSIISLSNQFHLDVNDSYLEMTGYARPELIGSSIAALNLRVDPQLSAKLTDRLREGKSVRNLESRLRTKAGEQRTTLLSAEAITLGENPFALVTELDISQRLELENQLRQAQKMEAIGHLAAGVAHDFRNILTVIQGHATLRLAGSNLDTRLKESLNQIIQASDRASNLTRQLLAFSRKQIMQLETVTLNDLISNLSSMLARLIGEDIAMRSSFAEDLPYIEADVCSIEQVVLNLVVNARDAMPSGGRLNISTSVREFDTSYIARNPEALPGCYVCLTVSDTGCGMSEQTKDRLFEPFFTTKEVGKGTGMGLATVYGIIKQHNGWIEVESRPFEGATFRVFLPASAVQTFIPEKRTPLPEALGGRERILVVEDEEPVREFVSEMLKEYGYDVQVACSGVDAVRVWRDVSGEIDLLFTDVVMPEEISGLQLAERLTKEKEDLKVIYTSGYSMELVNKHFCSERDFHFLPKPYHPQKLAEMVRTCLDS